MKKLNLSFLKNITDEEKILLNQVADWTLIVENRYLKKYSFFLDERQSDLCERVLNSLKFSSYSFYGGHTEAIRRILCVYPEYDIAQQEDFPIKSLLFKYKNEYTLSHRDFLGALMSLNIARNTIGDIIVGEGCTQIYVYETVCDMICESISKIGRIGVSIEQSESEQIKSDLKYEKLSGTVASLRLDCILSLALHISREKAKAIILSKGAVVNHMITYSTDTILNAGDIFSVRGFGKFVFESINGVSKKNRFHITLNKFV